jgi:Calpain family cysteine protease
MKMRNPWGTGVEWKGNWSDHWSMWTPELKKQLGWTDAVDGLFFISLNEYLSHYSYTSVCFSAATNVHSGKVFDMKTKKTIYLSFTVKKRINL